MRIQIASGREQICPVTLTSIAGNLSAGTYYFWLQGRNDIGYNLMSDSRSITIADNEGIRVTLPADCYREGENWVRYAISVNDEDDPTTSELLLEIDGVNDQDVPITLPKNIDLTELEHLDFGDRLVTDLPVANLIEGLIRNHNGVNKRYTSASVWETFELDSFRTFVFDTTEDVIGCDQSIEDLDTNTPIIRKTYGMDGSVGRIRRYWIYNDLSTDIEQGSKVNLNITLGGQDVVDSYENLLVLGFDGYFNRNTGSLDKYETDGLTLLPYVGTEDPFTKNMPSLVIPKAIEQNYAWQIYIYPQFHSYELYGASSVPAYNAELQIWPYVQTTAGTYVGLESITGNIILNAHLTARRVYPDSGLSAIVLAGEGLINGYSWSKNQDSILGIQPNTANQIVAIDNTGLCFIAPALAANLEQRSLISTVTGESISSTTGDFQVTGSATPTPIFNVTLTHPTFVRTNYPDVIAGEAHGNFNAEEIVFYAIQKDALEGNVLATRKFTASVADGASTTVSLDWSTGTDTAETPSDTEFGLWSPNVPVVNSTDAGAGATTLFYEVTAQFKYNGNSVTNISHNPADGCIEEFAGTLGSLSTLSKYYRLPLSNLAAITALSEEELFHEAIYPVLSANNDKPRLYVYLSDNVETPNGTSIIEATNGTGNFVLISGEDGQDGIDGKSGFGLTYYFDTTASGVPNTRYFTLEYGNNSFLLPQTSELKVNKTDRYFDDQEAILSSLNPGSIFLLASKENNTKYLLLQVDSFVDNDTYLTYAVTFLGRESTPSQDEEFLVIPSFRGLDGTNGTNGTNGINGTNGVDGKNGFGIPYIFDDALTSGVASGELRLNNADITLATEMFVSENDVNSVNMSTLISYLDVGSILSFRSLDTDNEYAFFAVSGEVTNNGADYTIPISYIVHTGTFTDLENVLLIPTLKGEKGDQGQAGTSGFGVNYAFSTTTTPTPSNGTLRFNNAVIESVTEVYLSETDATTTDISTLLELISNGSPVQVIKNSESTTFALFTITGITDNGADRTLAVTYIAHNGTFADADSVRFTFSAKGTEGQQGTPGNTILSDTSDPIDNVTGSDGDFYINTATSTFFGPRVAGLWGSGESLKGPEGSVASASDIKLTPQGTPPSTGVGEISFYANTDGIPTFRAENNGTARQLAYLEFDINTEASSTYTLQLIDRYGKRNFTSNSAITLTIPANSSVDFPIGSAIVVEQSGTGAITIVEDTGVTIKAAGNRKKISEQYGTATLIYEGSDVWSVSGNLSL